MKNNNKGFTLIELLAVVVILILIIFIAITKVRQSSKKAQLDSIKANAGVYIKAVNEFAGVDNLTSDRMYSGTFGKIYLDAYGVKINGSLPDIASVTMEDFEVTSACLTYGRYKVTYSDGKLSEPTKGKCVSGDDVVIAYADREQQFVAPVDGTYKIEAWGAQGGSSSYNSYKNNGGPGGYSTGTIELKAGDILYINVGGKGTSVTYNQSAGEVLYDESKGYNGGGYACYYSNNSSHGGGGGATSISFKSGVLKSLSNSIDSIVIVAGGGGGSSTHSDYGNYSGDGGSGGGSIGASGIPTSGKCYQYTKGGSQTTVGSISTCSSGGNSGRGDTPTPSPSFGLGGNHTSNTPQSNYAGGGAGLYGSNSAWHGPAGGGSGYIGNFFLKDKSMYCKNCSESDDKSTKTISVTCSSTEPKSQCTKLGDGSVKISLISKNITTNKYYYAYTGEIQTFTAPKTGTYKLEVWGASGGSVPTATANPGFGSYSYGNVTLTEGETLYITVGGSGDNASGGSGGAGGFNGGGYGSSGVNANSKYPGAGGGGGATHISKSYGLLDSLSENIPSILIVAGGGGGAGAYYTSSDAGLTGGSAGGIEGKNGSIATATLEALGGTQTTGYAFGRGGNGRSATTAGSSSYEGCGGGGAGFYGGYAQTTQGVGTDSSGAGGSGYIGNSLLSNKGMYCYGCTEDSNESTKTTSTTCVSTEPTEKCAKKGSGFAIITIPQ